MKKSTITRASIALGAGALLAIAAPLAASAHISIDPTETGAGSYSVLTFSVGHGCEGSPTTSVAIEIPESILAVTPTINPGWNVEKVMEPLETAVEDSHGESVEERVGSVVYTAKTPLPDDIRDTLALSLQLPAGEAGDTLEFRTTQVCEVGQTVWEGEDVPSVTLTAAAEGDGHGHSDGAETEHAADKPAATESGDVLARVLGIGGLVVGAVGVVLAVTARRKATV